MVASKKMLLCKILGTYAGYREAPFRDWRRNTLRSAGMGDSQPGGSLYTSQTHHPKSSGPGKLSPHSGMERTRHPLCCKIRSPNPKLQTLGPFCVLPQCCGKHSHYSNQAGLLSSLDIRPESHLQKSLFWANCGLGSYFLSYGLGFRV